MAGDYSRDRFDRDKRFSGVLMQQGRVQLDSDWNEAVAIGDRRWRAETLDVIGPCGVPEETPDGFKIEIDGDGALTIGRGRLYLDGHLAECFGALPEAFDAVLEELRGTVPLPFPKQPWFPGAETLEVPAGRHLVFLDLWRREVTFLEDPGLVEPAVGVNTTTRWQTAWRVDLLLDVGKDVTCETADADIPGWIEHTRPTAGRLSSRPAAAASDQGPCLIPPSEGYRGLENRLYRVEIHDPGPVGTATFSWSRHNGVVATSVTAIPALDTLRVVRTQRDPVLRFNSGDWVEITDDARELAGLPGVMRQVATVHDGTNTLTLTDDLPAGEFPTDAQHLTDPSRHTRVRRWDQSGAVRDTDGNLLVDLDAPGASGVVRVPAAGTWVALEDGVEIGFATDAAIGADFHSGDFWLIATRTADRSVEELDTAPPRGAHHHFCRLAVVDHDGETFIGTPLDCRPKFPPLTDLGPGCCTVVVEVGDDVQAGIDALPPSGGCVCLKTGTHLIEKTLHIAISNVVLKGESPQTVVRMRAGARMLRVEPQDPTDVISDIVIASLRFELLNKEPVGKPGPGVIELARCERVRIQDCWVSLAQPDLLTGVLCLEVDDLTIERCRIEHAATAVWVVKDSQDIAIHDCELIGAVEKDVEQALAGVRLQDVRGACRIERSHLTGFLEGIVLNDDPSGTRPASFARGSVIAGNTVERLGPDGNGDGTRLFGIDVAAPQSVIRDNLLRFASPLYGGIRVLARECRVEGNVVESRLRDSQKGELPTGILVGIADDGIEVDTDRCTVHGNLLSGLQDAIWIDRNLATEVTDNRIERAKLGGARYAIYLTDTASARVAGNRVEGSSHGIRFDRGERGRALDNHLEDGDFGFTVVSHGQLRAAGNRVESMKAWGFGGANLIGTTTLGSSRFRSCGSGGPAMSVGVFVGLGEIVVDSCEVLDTGVSADQKVVVQPAFGIAALLVFSCRIEGNRVGYSNPLLPRDPAAEDRSLLLWGLLEVELTDLIVFGGTAQILGNTMAGTGASSLVELLELLISKTVRIRFESVIFADNRCDHWVAKPRDNTATVSLRGRSAIVTGNRVTSIPAEGVRSVAFNGVPGPFIGNHTTGKSDRPAAAQFPSPETAFNL
jgi:nitrous oxidase accessory protein NosD